MEEYRVNAGGSVYFVRRSFGTQKTVAELIAEAVKRECVNKIDLTAAGTVPYNTVVGKGTEEKHETE